MSEILDTARAVIARHDASPNSMHMSFCDAAPALAREVIRLHAAVTDEDRGAAATFRREADACTSRARIYEVSAKTRQAPAFQRADLQLALGQHELAGAYRAFAEALLRPDETAALRAEVAALKAERDALAATIDAVHEVLGNDEVLAIASLADVVGGALVMARAAAIEEAAKVADAEARNADETLRTFAWGTIGFYRHANRKAVAKELAASIRALAAK